MTYLDPLRPVHLHELHLHNSVMYKHIVCSERCKTHNYSSNYIGLMSDYVSAAAAGREEGAVG